MAKEKRKSTRVKLLQPYRRLYMIKNSGELIVLAQPLIFIHNLIH